MNVTETTLAATHPDKRNANRGTDRGREALRHSLETYGAGRSILLARDGTILAGNKSAEAAADVGIDDLLVVETDGSKLVAVKRTDLDPDSKEARELAIADNQTGSLGLDFDPLVIDEALKDGLDLSPYFTGDELEELLRGLEPEGGLLEGADPDAIPEAVEPRAKPGDLWQLGRHRVGCFDSTDPDAVARLLENKKPVLMATDPPYGVDLDQGWRDRAGLYRLGPAQDDALAGDNRADWGEAFRLSGATVAYVWHADRFAPAVHQTLTDCGYEVKQQIIWVKTVHTLSRSSYHFKHEPCWFAVKKGQTIPWYAGRDQMTVWEAASPRQIMSGSDEEKFDHPTQKPIELYRIPIVNHTRPGDLVYDAFLGSGTALMAAEDTGRGCYGCELAPQYVDIVLARWESATGETARRL